MKKLLTLTFLFSLIYGASFAQGTAVTGNDPGQIKFINQDTTYDFGEIPAGAGAQYKFEFKNTGKDDIVITEAHCSIPNVSIKWPNKPVKHGKKGIIIVTVPTAEIGTFKDDVFVTATNTTTPYPYLHIFGAVVPAGSAGRAGGPVNAKGTRRDQ